MGARAVRATILSVPALERWMAWSFAVGSACFLVGPFPGYADLVGERADAVTFFVGSIFFTAGGGPQTAPARADRPQTRARRAARGAGTIHSAGAPVFYLPTLLARAPPGTPPP